MSLAARTLEGEQADVFFFKIVCSPYRMSSNCDAGKAGEDMAK